LFDLCLEWFRCLGGKTLTEQARQALVWITELLRSNNVPFQVIGGLAARAYGSTRPLRDIDLYVPGDRLEQVAMLAAEYVVRGPWHQRDERWDIAFMALDYGGQRIELGGAEGRYYDSKAACWRLADIDFERSELREVFGVTTPLMPREQLIEYKRRLGRPVDLVDLEELAESVAQR